MTSNSNLRRPVLRKTQKISQNPLRSRAFSPAFATTFGAVFQTDCLRMLRAMKDSSVDTVFADPPFNLAKDYGNGKHLDDLADASYLKWCRSWIKECVRLLKPGGAFFIYNLPRWSYFLAADLESHEMQFRHWIALSMKTTFPRGKRLYPAHYALLYFTKGEPKTFNRVYLPVASCRHCKRDVKDYGGYRKFLNPMGISLTDFWEDTAPARHQNTKA